MATVPQLTPKQQQVYDALARGKSPNEIATRMGITPAGVYGHMRKMRSLGFTLPNEAPDTSGTAAPEAPPAPPVAATNGTAADPEAALRAALARGSARIAEIQAEQDQLTSRREELEGEHKALETQQQKYTSALEQLT